MRRIALLTALLLTSTAAHAQQSIVVNGSFEEPQAGGAFGIFPTIPGWRTVSGPGIEVQSTEQTMVPRSVVEVGPGDARKLLKLLDALDEQDDVDQVHANFDIGAEVLEEATA